MTVTVNIKARKLKNNHFLYVPAPHPSTNGNMGHYIWRIVKTPVSHQYFVCFYIAMFIPTVFIVLVVFILHQG